MLCREASHQVEHAEPDIHARKGQLEQALGDLRKVALTEGDQGIEDRRLHILVDKEEHQAREEEQLHHAPQKPP
jgi:hypothetical protein